MRPQRQGGGLDRVQMKYLAAAAMLADHIGMLFVPVMISGKFSFFGAAFRFFGRLTAPVMCFFLAEGFVHTSSRKRYALRLAFFALLSQLVYAPLHHGTLLAADFNMIFTLLLAFLMLCCLEAEGSVLLKWAAVSGLVFVSLFCDWSFYALLFVFLFYCFRDDRKKQAAAFSCAAGLLLAVEILKNVLRGVALYPALVQSGLFLFLPFLFLYNGKPGSPRKFHKWFFYFFYPAHQAILFWLLRMR